MYICLLVFPGHPLYIIMTFKAESVTQPVLLAHNCNRCICEAEAEEWICIWGKPVPQPEFQSILGHKKMLTHKNNEDWIC